MNLYLAGRSGFINYIRNVKSKYYQNHDINIIHEFLALCAIRSKLFLINKCHRLYYKMINKKQQTQQYTNYQNKQQIQGQIAINNIGDYQLGKTIGKGSFGKVRQGFHKITCQKVAIKIIDKILLDQDDKRRVTRQVQILRLARHPNIIHLYEIIQTPEHIYIITEFAEKGQLFDLMVSEIRLKENAAGRIFIQILNAVQYLHRQKIAHRDLKPQNILFDVDFNIKLIDFGLSNYMQKNKLLSTACGSPSYAPPQMIAGNAYDGILGDSWSLGVIFYFMICGSLPFKQKTNKQLYQKVKQGFYLIPSDISFQATEVIRKLLVTNPQQRISIKQLRKLKFIQNLKSEEPQVVGILVGHHPTPIDDEIIDCMKSVLKFDRKVLQDDLKKNKHNQKTTTYYLTQKKVLRQRGKTVMDLQIFLQNHHKYSKSFGKQSLQNKYKQTNELEKLQQQNPLQKLKTDFGKQKQTNLNATPIKIIKSSSNNKRQIFYSVQKAAKTPKKLDQNMEATQIIIRKHYKQNNNQVIKGKQTAKRYKTDRNKQPTSPPTDNFQSNNKRSQKKLKSTERSKRKVADLCPAYLKKQQIFQSKNKKNHKKNHREQQKLNFCTDKIKKLKEEFTKLSNTKRKLDHSLQ